MRSWGWRRECEGEEMGLGREALTVMEQQDNRERWASWRSGAIEAGCGGSGLGCVRGGGLACAPLRGGRGARALGVAVLCEKEHRTGQLSPKGSP